MILIPAKYAEIAVGFDFLILIMSMLFRKSKFRTETSSLDRKCTKYAGYYIVGSAIVVLAVVHYAYFPSYLDYFTGLALDSFLFYLGLRVIVYE